jgi:hypothetical protein
MVKMIVDNMKKDKYSLFQLLSMMDLQMVVEWKLTMHMYLSLSLKMNFVVASIVHNYNAESFDTAI